MPGTEVGRKVIAARQIDTRVRPKCQEGDFWSRDLNLGTRLYIQLGDNANMVETVGEGRCELLAGMAKSAFTGDPLVPTTQNRGGVPEVFNEGMNE